MIVSHIGTPVLNIVVEECELRRSVGDINDVVEADLLHLHPDHARQILSAARTGF